MPRITHVAWWCHNGHKNAGSSRECAQCSHKRFEKHAQIHSSERAVVYVNPATGERRTPPRADMPMPEVYARQGFERHEIMSMVEYEKTSGSVHEATNFQPGNEPTSEKYAAPSVPKDVKEAIIKDVVEAAASGPWTGADKIIDPV